MIYLLALMLSFSGPARIHVTGPAPIRHAPTLPVNQPNPNPIVVQF